METFAWILSVISKVLFAQAVALADLQSEGHRFDSCQENSESFFPSLHVTMLEESLLLFALIGNYDFTHHKFLLKEVAC